MNIDVSTGLAKLAYAVAAATVIGGGTMVLKTAERTAVLESKQEDADRRPERMEQKLDRVLERLPAR